MKKIVLILCCFVSACSAIEIPFITYDMKQEIENVLPTIEKGKGQLCVIRPLEKQFPEHKTTIWIDTNSDYSVDNNSFVCINLEPKTYEVGSYLAQINNLRINRNKRTFVLVYDSAFTYIDNMTGPKIYKIDNEQAYGFLYTIIHK